MFTKVKTGVLSENGESTFNYGSTEELSFAELLEEYQPEPMRRGQYVTGTILQKSQNIILADVDAKRTAIVPPQDVVQIDEEELEQLSIGDEVVLYVLSTPKGDDELLVSLNKGLEQRDWQLAAAHMESEEPLELEIVGFNKGGLLVSFGHLRGFVPASHVPQLQNVQGSYELQARKAELVGKELLLNVIEVDSKRRRLILSAKKAQKEMRQQRLEELQLKEGKTITGTITNLVDFGAFIDLKGVEGLIHISEIAWEKVDDPVEYLKPGDEVEVEIMSVDIDRVRISLSRKALMPSPWELFEQRHNIDDLLEGVVTSVADFGAFVLVEDGIEGLVHVSEMNGTQEFSPQDILSSGDTVLVRILNIQPDQERLSLSQRRVSNDEEVQWIWQRQQDTTALVEDEEE
ncbi:MAG: 30S ribosomal protein S1 [Candidatus Promineifilaceae bacterium]|jgi:small subunit ribosomal protein S1